MVLRKNNNFNGHRFFFLNWISVHLLGNASKLLVNLFAHDFPNIGRFLGPLEVPYVWTKPGGRKIKTCFFVASFVFKI